MTAEEAAGTMFVALTGTISLMGTSWRVLRDHNLLIFPLAAGLALFVLLVYVLVAFQYGGTFDRLSRGFDILPADVIFLAMACLGASFIIIYFSGGLIASAHYRILGGSPDFRLGLEAANDRLGALVLWSVIVCTAGLLLRPLALAAGAAGRGGSSVSERLGGLSSFLALSVVMVEGAHPLDATRRSASMLRDTWGGHPAGNFGFGPLYFLLLVAAPVPAIALYAVGTSSAVVVVASAMLLALAVATLKCLEVVFIVALYHYASVGETDGAFPEDVLRRACTSRRHRDRLAPPTSHRRAAA